VTPETVGQVVGMLRCGHRVRVIAANAPECRTGTIVEVDPGGRGYRVHHDTPPWTSGLFAGKQDFNWGFNEVVPLTPTKEQP